VVKKFFLKGYFVYLHQNLGCGCGMAWDILDLHISQVFTFHIACFGISLCAVCCWMECGWGVVKLVIIIILFMN